MNDILKDVSMAHRIVVKVGTSTLTYEHGTMNLKLIDRLSMVLSDLRNQGKEIILVSSGAQGIALGKLGLAEKPKDTKGKQAIAAVGQCELMYLYDNLFDNYGIIVAQMLLTKTIIENPERKKNVENTFEKLISMGVVPIVNENDTVAIDELELEIGENDSLSAIVATFAHADLLVILSDIDGLYNSDPHKNPDAKLIPVVTEIDEHITDIAGGAGSALGTGGMATKINAAKIANDAGIDMIIMNGNNPDKLYDLFENNETGTLFVSHSK